MKTFRALVIVFLTFLTPFTNAFALWLGYNLDLASRCSLPHLSYPLVLLLLTLSWFVRKLHVYPTIIEYKAICSEVEQDENSANYSKTLGHSLGKSVILPLIAVILILIAHLLFL